MTIPRMPPGPKSRLPGGLLLKFRRDPIAFLTGIAKEHGRIARFTIGPQVVFVLNHPDSVKEVLVTQQKSFVKGGALVRAKRFLGEGLLTSEGEVHQKQRRLVQPAFHRKSIAGFADVMTDYAARMRGRWTEGQEYDVWQEMMHLTLAIVGKTLFGADVEKDAPEIEQAINAMLAVFDTVTLPFSQVLQAIPTPTNRRATRGLKQLDALIYRMIAERKASGVEHPDLLGMLIAAEDEESVGTRMGARQVRDEAMTLFLAGHETTANSLTWTWYQLAVQPGIQDVMHAELDAVLGDRLPTLEDIPKLVMTERILAESMRLFPPGWAIGRRCIKPVEIDGYRIPKGALVLMSQYLIHRSPEFFPEPETFDLGRWTPEAKAARPHFAYFPFGGGPRGCVGEPFAWMEGVLILATIGQMWKLRLVPGHVVEPEPLVTLRPRYGMRMVVEHR